jgi:hypothetical protein
MKPGCGEHKLAKKAGFDVEKIKHDSLPGS